MISPRAAFQGARLRITLLAAGALGLVACQPDIEAVAIAPLTTPPVPALVGDGSLRLAAGTGIGIDLYAFTQDPGRTTRDIDPVDPDEVSIDTSDDQIVTVSQVDGPTFIVVGARPGTAFLEIASEETDGIFRLPVEVVAQ